MATKNKKVIIIPVKETVINLYKFEIGGKDGVKTIEDADFIVREAIDTLKPFDFVWDLSVKKGFTVDKGTESEVIKRYKKRR